MSFACNDAMIHMPMNAWGLSGLARAYALSVDPLSGPVSGVYA